MSKTNQFGAIGPLVGFIYQEYYFLYRLLTIQDGEIVSLEKVDDVGVEGGDKLSYYQLKHSFNSKPSAIRRMTDRDNDLWKTLSMWVSIIKKKGNDEAQRRWIENSEFMLISNKTAERNNFFGLVEAYKTNESKWSELEKYLAEQAAKEPQEVKDDKEKYSKSVYQYTKNVSEYGLKKEFLKKVSAKYESDEELLEKISREIQYKKHIPEKRVSDMRYMLMGGVTEAVSQGKAEYTMKSFDEAFGSLFNDMRTRKFITLNRKVVLPERPMEQTFVKQLQGIDASKCNDIKEVIRLTEQKLQFENDYNASNNSAGARVQRQFEKDMHTEWRNIFDDKNDGLTFMSDEPTKKNAGKAVLKEVKKVRLKYDQEDIGPSESNGCYYHFSDGDVPQIGWRCDWETLYNGKEWTTD